MRPVISRKPRAPAGSRRFRPPRRTRLPSRSSGTWPRRHALYFDLLVQFVRREGHARVVESHREGNFSLGYWVSKRRSAHRTGLLTREQIRALEALPGWTWSPRDDDFQRGLAVLEAFVKRVEHARVPWSHVERGFNLGAWVGSKRNDHAQGRLPPGRTRALEALPGWSWRPRDDAFQTAISALRRFVRREGHARVPYGHREGAFPLGHWLDTLRRAHAQGKLAPARARLAEALPGWTWHARQDLFDEGLRALKGYLWREGHARVPSSHVERGFQLGLWVVNRRNEHRRGRLPRDRARALQKLPGWAWNTRAASFATNYRMLLRYVKREGHAQVPTEHSERGIPLGAWVHKCRQKRAEMPSEHARRLSALPGWAWNKFDWQFEKALSLLRAFARREGHARVPARHVERGFRLGGWVSHCRSRRATLTRERRQALEAVRGWVWRLGPRRARRGA